MSLPAGTDCPAEVTCSRKQGDRGKGDYERPLREGAHRSRPPAIFGSFHRWKERSPLPRPAGRNPRGEAQLRTKFFCLLFFQEK